MLRKSRALSLKSTLAEHKKENEAKDVKMGANLSVAKKSEVFFSCKKSRFS